MIRFMRRTRPFEMRRSRYSNEVVFVHWLTIEYLIFRAYVGNSYQVLWVLCDNFAYSRDANWEAYIGECGGGIRFATDMYDFCNVRHLCKICYILPWKMLWCMVLFCAGDNNYQPMYAFRGVHGGNSVCTTNVFLRHETYRPLSIIVVPIVTSRRGCTLILTQTVSLI